jgi:hypothetical protein
VPWLTNSCPAALLGPHPPLYHRTPCRNKSQGELFSATGSTITHSQGHLEKLWKGVLFWVVTIVGSWHVVYSLTQEIVPSQAPLKNLSRKTSHLFILTEKQNEI